MPEPDGEDTVEIIVELTPEAWLPTSGAGAVIRDTAAEGGGVIELRCSPAPRRRAGDVGAGAGAGGQGRPGGDPPRRLPGRRRRLRPPQVTD